jgi:hypothetical protein
MTGFLPGCVGDSDTQVTGEPDLNRQKSSVRPIELGDELGIVTVQAGDDHEKGGENIWISRIGIDLPKREAQPGVSSETKARRTPTDHRKEGRREAGREAARRTGRWPRDRRKVVSRVGFEFRKGLAAGAGGRFRQQTVRVRNGDFPGVARLGPGWDCPTRSRHDAGGTSQMQSRGAREASAERLLGTVSRPGLIPQAIAQTPIDHKAAARSPRPT